MEEMNKLVWTGEEWNELMNETIEELKVAFDTMDEAGDVREGVLTDDQIVTLAKQMTVGDMDLLLNMIEEPQAIRLFEVIVDGLIRYHRG